MRIDPTVQKSLAVDEASLMTDTQIHKSVSIIRTLSASKLPEWIIDFNLDVVLKAMADVPKTLP